VQWSSLIGAVVGALIGVSATVASEHMRWRRGRQDSDKATKRQTYADYLAALSLTRNELRLAALKSSIPPPERSKRAAKAFSTGRTYELRYQVALIAPMELTAASDHAFRSLRQLRDLVQDGTLRTDSSYAEQKAIWEAAFTALRDRMKNDLEVS
jgi:hypothetical protein